MVNGTYIVLAAAEFEGTRVCQKMDIRGMYAHHVIGIRLGELRNGSKMVEGGRG